MTASLVRYTRLAIALPILALAIVFDWLANASHHAFDCVAPSEKEEC